MEERAKEFQRLSGWNIDDAIKFVEMVHLYLYQANYFIDDVTGKKRTAPFSEWLTAMSELYKMESGNYD